MNHCCLYHFILHANHRSIVVVAVQDEAFRFGRRYLNVLRSIGARGGRNFRFGFRGSYALIGYKGRRKYWIRETSRPRRRGPSYLTVRIPKGICTFIVSSKGFQVFFCYRCLLPWLLFFRIIQKKKKKKKRQRRKLEKMSLKLFLCDFSIVWIKYLKYMYIFYIFNQQNTTN